VIDVVAIRSRFAVVAPFLDERGRRLVAASEAPAAGRGGVKAVCAATAVARSTIGRGLAELRGGADHLGGRVRRAGGGRKAAIDRQTGPLEALSELVQSAIRGDPRAPLLWVSRSQRLSPGRWPTAASWSATSWSAGCMTPDDFHGEWNYTISPAEPTD
jgi:hypothetical protein